MKKTVILNKLRDRTDKNELQTSKEPVKVNAHVIGDESEACLKSVCVLNVKA